MPSGSPKKPERRSAARRAADSSLLSDHRFLSAILNTDSVLIILLDLEGRIYVFNRVCEHLTGVSSADARGRHFWEISDAPENQQQARQFFERLLERDFPETHERAWLAGDGTPRLLRWSLSKVKGQQGGELLVAVGYDITEIGEAERQLTQRSAQLAERVKELRCLYGITRLAERPGLGLDEFLQGVAELIPPAWQFPEHASAEIEVEGHSYATTGYALSGLCQQRPVVVESQQLGHVRVCYSQDFPGLSDAPFLEEEERLLENIADAIGRTLLNYRSRERIAAYQARLRSLASELALTGERERRRIAQQLHDDIGHNLALLKFRLGEQRAGLPGGEYEQLSGLLETCIQASRTLTFELSPPVLHELGLAAALEWLSHQLETNYGITCNYEDDRRPKPLTEDLRVEVFQAARELLANTGKHSGASEAWISTRVDGQMLEVIIGDDGRGFDVARRQRERNNLGFGLFSIRERLAHLDGSFELESAPGQGTEITLRVPLESAAGQEVAPGLAQPRAGEAAAASPSISILLADDQQLTRAGLRSLLEREGDLRVVGEAGTGTQAVELAAELNPDVVVMDVAMPGLNGIEATRQIIEASPVIKVIGLSMHSDGQYVLEMLRAGATGYLLKDCAQEDLAQAIRIVQANLTFLSPGLADSVAGNFTGPPAGVVKQESGLDAQDAAAAQGAPELTPRETEVLVLLARGGTTKEIAHQLGVSVKTIESHRQHIMEKLDDNTIAGLTRFAIQRGLVKLG